MNSLERMLQDLAETRAAEAAKPQPEPIADVVQLRPTGPTCETDGHEYDFGICLDCDQPQPDYEPDDDMITNDYLNRSFAA